MAHKKFKSGNKYCQYEFYSRFPDCAVSTRSCVLPDGARAIEQEGENDHSIELFFTGLSQRHKDEAVSLLTINVKFKPVFIRTEFENKHHVTF